MRGRSAPAQSGFTGSALKRRFASSTSWLARRLLSCVHDLDGTIQMKGHVLILTGPPGAGKSTAARNLASVSDDRAVHLHADDFWHFIGKGAIPPYLPEAHQQNAVVMEALAQAADAYARGGYFVIVDGIVGPWFLASFNRVSSPLHYVALRPALATAIERCQSRGGDTLTDPTAITALYEQFSDLGALENHVIDTVGQSAEDTIAAIRRALASGSFRREPQTST